MSLKLKLQAVKFVVFIKDTMSSAQNILFVSHYNAYNLQNKLFNLSYFPLKKLKM